MNVYRVHGYTQGPFQRIFDSTLDVPGHLSDPCAILDHHVQVNCDLVIVKVNVYPASPTGAVQWGKGKRVDAKPLLVRALQKRPVEATQPVPAPQPPPPPDIPKPAPEPPVAKPDSTSTSGYLVAGAVFAVVLAAVAFFILN